MILIFKIMLSALAVCIIVVLRCAFEDEMNDYNEDEDKNSCDVTTEKSTNYRTHYMSKFMDRK